MIMENAFFEEAKGIYRLRVPFEDIYTSVFLIEAGGKRIESILFSHAYEPWYTDGVFGRETVLECLVKCTEYIGE